MYGSSPSIPEMALRNPGTVVPFRTVNDIREGVSGVIIQNGFGMSAGAELTVTKVSGGKVYFEYGKRRKMNLEIGKFHSICHRRMGPVVSESLRPGLKMRAVADGKDFRRGAVVTLSETSGSVYGFTNDLGGKGSVKASEVALYFVYV